MIKHLLVLDHFGQENYQTNVYLYELYYVSFKHILINLTNFMGTTNSMRILYNTSFLTESYAFLKSKWIADVLFHYIPIFFPSIRQMQKIWSVANLLHINSQQWSSVVVLIYTIGWTEKAVALQGSIRTLKARFPMSNTAFCMAVSCQYRLLRSLHCSQELPFTVLLQLFACSNTASFSFTDISQNLN
jgi:hypothetical protein